MNNIFSLLLREEKSGLEKRVENDVYFRNFREQCHTAEKTLEKTLTSEQQKLFIDYCDAQTQLNAEETDIMFLRGFSTGVKLMLEALSE